MRGRSGHGGGLGLWALIALITAGADAKKRSSESDDAKKAPMPVHSFQVPLEYTSLLDDWSVSGASLLERERLLMHPGVHERSGFAFNKAALLTSDFEITVLFKVAGEKDGAKVSSDQSFAVWYVQENVSAIYNETQIIKAETWKAGMAEQQLTLSGSLGKFTGFGAVLSMKDADKKAKPSVSFVSNDGSRTLNFGQDVPTRGAKVVDFRNTLNAAQLRIRVRPASVEAHLKLSPSLSWNECFKIDHSSKPGGFVGLTAWSGTPSEGTVADSISILQVDLVNYDETSLGEEMKDVSAQIQNAYREMLTDDNRHFIDQKSQGEHLARLITMLDEHINTTKPADEKLFQEIINLEMRVNTFAEDCKLLTTEAHMLLGTDPKKSKEVGVAALKDQIMGLRRVLSKDSSASVQKLEGVAKVMTEVKQVTEGSAKGGGQELVALLSRQTAELVKTVNSRGSQMTYMMMCLLATIGGIGMLMWNRMYYYEKKHFI
mmetsp:Transcript_75627/g.198291  ORF Transcript_75627/g.198291 Transcript_75627/m.198291 type:complete len:489 (-) Transcript_75627:80-1546(-)